MPETLLSGSMSFHKLGPFLGPPSPFEASSGQLSVDYVQMSQQDNVSCGVWRRSHTLLHERECYDKENWHAPG